MAIQRRSAGESDRGGVVSMPETIPLDPDRDAWDVPEGLDLSDVVIYVYGDEEQ